MILTANTYTATRSFTGDVGVRVDFGGVGGVGATGDADIAAAGECLVRGVTPSVSRESCGALGVWGRSPHMRTRRRA